MTPHEEAEIRRVTESYRALLDQVVEFEKEREAIVLCLYRLASGERAPIPVLLPAVVADALEAIARVAAEHRQMTEGLDAFNTILGRAAARASEGRMVEATVRKWTTPCCSFCGHSPHVVGKCDECDCQHGRFEDVDASDRCHGSIETVTGDVHRCILSARHRGRCQLESHGAPTCNAIDRQPDGVHYCTLLNGHEQPHHFSTRPNAFHVDATEKGR